MDSQNLLTEEELRALLDNDSSREEELKMDLKFKLVLDFPLDVSVRLGSSGMTIGQLLNLTVGTVIELEAMVNDPVDLMVNGRTFAQGEVITVGETFGVRLKNISNPQERVETLR
jgi:flagellar motor switch protein FliN